MPSSNKEDKTIDMCLMQMDQISTKTILRGEIT